MKDQLGAASATQCYSSPHKSSLKLSKSHPPTHRQWRPKAALRRLSAAPSLTPFPFLLVPLYLVCYGWETIKDKVCPLLPFPFHCFDRIPIVPYPLSSYRRLRTQEQSRVGGSRSADHLLYGCKFHISSRYSFRQIYVAVLPCIPQTPTNQG